MNSPKDDPPYDDYRDYDPDGDIHRHLIDPNDHLPEPLPPVTFPSDYVHPDNIPPAPNGSAVTEPDEALDELSMMFDFSVEDILDFGPDEGAAEGRDVVMEEASAVAEASNLGFRPVQHFYSLPCHICSRGNELNDYRNGVYNARLFLHAQNGVFHHLLFFIEHTQDVSDTAYEAFYFGFEGQNLATINASLAQYGVQLNGDGGLILLNNNTLLDVYRTIHESLGDYRPGGTNTINLPQSLQEPSSSNVNDMAEPDSDGEESDSEGDTEDEDGNDAIDEDSGLPWVEGPGESSSNAGSVINARLAAAMNARLEEGVPPRPRLSLAQKKAKLGNLTVYDLAAHFHLQAAHAAKRLNISQTSLKNQNKRLDVRRWPQRKVRAINMRIRDLTRQIQRRVEQGKIAESVRLQTALENMRDKRAALFLEYLTRPPRPKPKRPNKRQKKN